MVVSGAGPTSSRTTVAAQLGSSPARLSSSSRSLRPPSPRDKKALRAWIAPRRVSRSSGVLRAVTRIDSFPSAASPARLPANLGSV